MKKGIFLAASLTLLFSVSVQAEDATSVNVSTYIRPSYSVRIPADAEIAYGDETTGIGAVELVSARIEPDMCISVSAKTDGLLVNAASDDSVIPYRLMTNDTLYIGSIFTEAGEKTDLQIAVTEEDWEKADAGNYDGTIVFTVRYMKRQ